MTQAEWRAKSVVERAQFVVDAESKLGWRVTGAEVVGVLSVRIDCADGCSRVVNGLLAAFIIGSSTP